jgi:hypothetical protein
MKVVAAAAATAEVTMVTTEVTTATTEVTLGRQNPTRSQPRKS